MNVALYEQIDRAVKFATTYLRKSGDALHWTKDRPINVGYWTLLDTALDTARDIVEELPDDFFEDSRLGDPFGVVTALGGDPSERYNQSDDPLERAEKVVAAIRARRERADVRRVILRLEETTGRTEQEAESFRAKAAELRERHGIA